MSSASGMKRRIMKEVLYKQWQGRLPQIGAPAETTWYIDSAATGDADGTSWTNAFVNFSSAIDACSDYDRIYFRGGISETISYDDYTVGPNRISIIGVDTPIASPRWYSVGNAAPMITLNCYGWTFENIRFVGPAAYPALYLRMEAAAGGAYNTTVKNCWFYGVSRDSGIEFYGAPYMCNIIGCWFDGYNAGQETAIYNTDTSFAAMRICRFIDNHFVGNTNHVVLNQINDSIFTGNIFQGDGLTVTTDKKLYFTNGGSTNVIYNNFLGGTDWSITGGYKGGTGDCWLGNTTGEVSGTATTDVGGTKAVVPPAS